jgi:hypothetical protein
LFLRQWYETFQTNVWIHCPHNTVRRRAVA